MHLHHEYPEESLWLLCIVVRENINEPAFAVVARDHFLEARSGHISDGHPPALVWLFKITEVFVTGPVGILVINSVTLLVGLYMLFSLRTSRLRA